MPGGSKKSQDRSARSGGTHASEDFQRALSYAFKLLGYRQRSVKELIQRLEMKGFSPTTAKAVTERLRESGYMDDQAMAGSLRRRAEEGKLLGFAGARQYLRRMGISRQDTDEALEGYDEAASASRLADKKMNTLANFTLPVARQRLSGYLKRRGYSYETVRKTIDAFIKEEK